MKARRAVRYVLINTNYWKSFVHARLAMSMGDSGCLSLFKADSGCGDHRMLVEQLLSGYRVKAGGAPRFHPTVLTVC